MTEKFKKVVGRMVAAGFMFATLILFALPAQAQNLYEYYSPDFPDELVWYVNQSSQAFGLTYSAADLDRGELSDSRLSSNVTLQGNSFNGNSELVQLTAGGLYPALDGSLITNVTATDSSKLPLAGGTMTGSLTMNDNDSASGDVNIVIGDADESGDIQGVANIYDDAAGTSPWLELSSCGAGKAVSSVDAAGTITCTDISITESQISDLSHTDSTKLPLAGGTLTGSVTMNDNDSNSGDVNLIFGDADETGNIQGAANIYDDAAGTSPYIELSGCGADKTLDTADAAGTLACQSISITESQISDLAHTTSASDLTSGELADARLSSNVPLLDQSNSFSAAQTINGLDIKGAGTNATICATACSGGIGACWMSSTTDGDIYRSTGVNGWRGTVHQLSPCR